MTREEFIASLRTGLAGHVAAREVNRLCAYYDEMILDLMEDGQAEKDAVAAMGSVPELVYAAVDAAAYTKPRGARHGIGWWLAVIVSSPLWGSLLLALAAIGVAAEALLWSIPLTGACLSGGFLVGGGLASMMSLPAMIAAPFYGVSELGLGLILVGGGMLGAWLTWWVSQYLVRAHAWAWRTVVAHVGVRREGLA